MCINTVFIDGGSPGGGLDEGVGVGDGYGFNPLCPSCTKPSNNGSSQTGEGVGVMVSVGVNDGVGVMVSVGVMVGVTVGVSDGVGVGVAVGVGLTEGHIIRLQKSSIKSKEFINPPIKTSGSEIGTCVVNTKLLPSNVNPCPCVALP
jgi:hypothetical protein